MASLRLDLLVSFTRDKLSLLITYTYIEIPHSLSVESSIQLVSVLLVRSKIYSMLSRLCNFLHDL
jgi:hypothetical protein